MKKLIFLLAAIFFAGTLSAQQFAIKNNLLWDAALTPNLGVEIGLGGKTTLDVSGNYNWFRFSEGKQWKHWLVQPEFRLWTCEKFNGTFFGIHAHAGQLNIANVTFPFDIYPKVRNHRYEGNFYGAGLSVGHQWILAPRWNLEAGIGAGWVHLDYDKYECGQCAPLIESGKHDYFGLTRAMISILFFIW